MGKDLRGAPIKLYRNGHQVAVHPIDADGWRANGYTEDPDNVVEEVADKPEGKEPKKAKSDKPEGKDAA